VLRYWIYFKLERSLQGQCEGSLVGSPMRPKNLQLPSAGAAKDRSWRAVESDTCGLSRDATNENEPREPVDTKSPCA